MLAMRGADVWMRMTERMLSSFSADFGDTASSLAMAPRLGVRVWDVAALIHAVSDALAARFGGVAVRGELSGYVRASSGHSYFTLRDADGAAALRCVMFKRVAQMMDFAPRDGDVVELRGRLTVYEPRGDLQFAVESMQRAGDGAWFERFVRLKAQFEAQGLFDTGRKRAVTPYPMAIGVVTSLGAAALHDVLTAMQRRAPHVRVVVYPSPVQGVEAAAALAAAIATANARSEVDTLIVCRGGGSIEDLWAFNEAAVVHAVAGSAIPVIVGVGHETDVSLADFAADVRAPTPTAAAELAARPAREVLESLQRAHAAFCNAVQRHMDRHAQGLDRAAARFARPGSSVAALRRRLEAIDHRHANALRRCCERDAQRLVQLGSRLQRAVPSAVLRARQEQRVLASRLGALDPKRVLQRGYAWLADERGRALVSVAQIASGQAIDATLADGRLRAVVGCVEHAPVDRQAALQRT